MQGLSAQRPLGALHTLASAADSVAPGTPSMVAFTCQWQALAQADQSPSVPRGLGHLLHRSVSSTSPQRPGSGWSPSKVILARTLSFSPRALLPSLQQVFHHTGDFLVERGALFIFPLWFLPDWKLSNTLAEPPSPSPSRSDLAERSHTRQWN